MLKGNSVNKERGGTRWAGWNFGVVVYRTPGRDGGVATPGFGDVATPGVGCGDAATPEVGEDEADENFSSAVSKGRCPDVGNSIQSLIVVSLT